MSAIRKALQAAASSPEPLPDAQGRRQRWLFDAGSVVFAGHFPDHPVLPAVVQILMAQMTLEDIFGAPPGLCAIVSAKFTAPLGPGDAIELLVQQGRRAGLWDCALSCAGQPASRFQIELTP